MKAIELLKTRENVLIDHDENGNYLIEFRLNKGKGTSPIRVPVELMGQIIEVLEVGPKIIEEKNIVDTIRNSLTYDLDENGEEVVVFRTRYGRGSKMQKIYKDEYEQVVSALKEINNDIPEVIATYEDLNK